MRWELYFSSAGFFLWATEGGEIMKKISMETAKLIFEIVGYTITMCSYTFLGKEPNHEDVNEATRVIFRSYLENEKGITEIVD